MLRSVPPVGTNFLQVMSDKAHSDQRAKILTAVKYFKRNEDIIAIKIQYDCYNLCKIVKRAAISVIGTKQLTGNQRNEAIIKLFSTKYRYANSLTTHQMGVLNKQTLEAVNPYADRPAAAFESYKKCLDGVINPHK